MFRTPSSSQHSQLLSEWREKDDEAAGAGELNAGKPSPRRAAAATLREFPAHHHRTVECRGFHREHCRVTTASVQIFSASVQ